MYWPRAADLESDVHLDMQPLKAPDSSVALVEGIFLHRDEKPPYARTALMDVDLTDQRAMVEAPLSVGRAAFSVRMAELLGAEPALCFAHGQARRSRA